MSSSQFGKRPRHASTEDIPGPTSHVSPIPLRSNKLEKEDVVAQPIAVIVESNEKNLAQPLGNGDGHMPSLEDDIYIHGVKLSVITVCVALSVLLVALVSFN